MTPAQTLGLGREHGWPRSIAKGEASRHLHYAERKEDEVTTCYTGCTAPSTSMVTHGPLPAPANPPAHAASLAFTGMDIVGLVLLGALLVTAGTLVVFWMRARS
jgi:hypothetical protein